jgi:hypothetical protein
MRTFHVVVVFAALTLVSACSSKGGGGNPVGPTMPTMVEVPAGYFTYVRDLNPPFDEVAAQYAPSNFQFSWVDSGGVQKISLDGGAPGHETGWITWNPTTNTATLNVPVRLPNDTEVWGSVFDGAKGIVGRVFYLHGTQLTDVRQGAASARQGQDTNPDDSHAVFQIAGII